MEGVTDENRPGGPRRCPKRDSVFGLIHRNWGHNHHCSLGGIVTGTVSVTGAVTNLITTPTIGGSDAPPCTRVSGDVVFSGSISGNTLTAQKNDVQQCAAGLVNRTLTVTLQKN
jgi:hypothetical protein